MSFAISETKALNRFDLIRYDIWGSYHVRAFCGAQYFLTIVDDASTGVQGLTLWMRRVRHLNFRKIIFVWPIHNLDSE